MPWFSFFFFFLFSTNLTSLLGSWEARESRSSLRSSSKWLLFKYQQKNYGRTRTLPRIQPNAGSFSPWLQLVNYHRFYSDHSYHCSYEGGKKQHQKEAAETAVNNGTLVSRVERELIRQSGLLTAAHPWKYTQAAMVLTWWLICKLKKPCALPASSYSCANKQTNSRCHSTTPPNCSFILLSTWPIQKYTKTHGDGCKWQIKQLTCQICILYTRERTEVLTKWGGAAFLRRFLGSKSQSHNRGSVATTADVVREAIVLVSVHEEGANVRRSIQAETAETSSLPPFSTNLSDKEPVGEAAANLDAMVFLNRPRRTLQRPIRTPNGKASVKPTFVFLLHARRSKIPKQNFQILWMLTAVCSYEHATPSSHKPVTQRCVCHKAPWWRLLFETLTDILDDYPAWLELLLTQTCGKVRERKGLLQATRRPILLFCRRVKARYGE